MNKFLFFIAIIGFFSFLHAENIDNLLSDFEEASDLSHKTKNEAAGNLIVYTRSDIERMQANTLKDLLKSMRFWNYQESRMGQPDLFNTDPLLYNSSSIRTYLNDHELFNPLMGSGFVLFGDIELDFIDHVEVYQGFPSFDFGTEPATIVIRLYSKTAEHDAGGRVKAQLGSYGSNSLSAYYAEESEGMSYFAYASRRDEKRKDIYAQGKSLLRDKRRERAYISIGSDNHRLEIHASKLSSDAFLSGITSVIDPTLATSDASALPDKADVDNLFFSAAIHSTFQDKSLIFDASVLKSTSDVDTIYNNPLAFRPNYTNPPENPLPTGQFQVDSIDQTVEESSYTIGLTKKFYTQNNTFSTGMKFRHNSFDLSNTQIEGYLNVGGTPIDVPFTQDQPNNTTDIYSVFVEDLYSINENNLISFSLMSQYYHNRHTDLVKNDTLWQRRLGYVYTNDSWVAKSFFTYEEFFPAPIATASPASSFGNANLRKSKYLSYLQEVSYKKDRFLSKVVFSFTKNKDMDILNPQSLVLENSSEDINIRLISFEETIGFRQNDKLEFQAFVTSIEYPRSSGFRSRYGGMMRLINTIDKFDIFNELVIREKQNSRLQNGHDYSAGIIYHMTKDLMFNVKGENIFDDGVEQEYIEQIDLSGNIKYINAPTIDRKFWFGMELLF